MSVPALRRDVPGGGPPPGQRGALCIVFLDDEEAILASLRSLFRREGYHMHFFSNGQEALEFIRKMPADILVSDLRMPGMTGIEFLNHASAVNPHAIRIILSGYEDKSVVLNALAKGLAQHYVLKPWDDKNLTSIVAESLQRLQELRRRRLEEVLGSINALPSPPRFHVRLQAMLGGADVSIDAIAGEIETSPPIVAKLLRVANSVYYAARKSVTSVREAVIFIGTEYIAGLVTAMEAFQGFGGAMGSEAQARIEILWGQAFRRAVIAKSIAEKWRGFDAPHLVHITSLLQDIGIAVRLCSEQEKFIRYQQLCDEKLMSPYEADKSVFGITHDDVGASLLEYWNLPREIVNGVARHHRPAGGDVLTLIVQIAGILSGDEPAAPRDPEAIDLAVVWREKVAQEVKALHSINDL